MHTYEHIAGLDRKDSMVRHLPRLFEQELRMKVEAAKTFVALERGRYDELGQHRIEAVGEGGDTEAYWHDLYLHTFQYNTATEAVLRAEGFLAVAERNLSAWKEEQTQKHAAELGIELDDLRGADA